MRFTNKSFCVYRYSLAMELRHRLLNAKSPEREASQASAFRRAPCLRGHLPASCRCRASWTRAARAAGAPSPCGRPGCSAARRAGRRAPCWSGRQSWRGSRAGSGASLAGPAGDTEGGQAQWGFGGILLWPTNSINISNYSYDFVTLGTFCHVLHSINKRFL